jgi:hypothetical protein
MPKVEADRGEANSGIKQKPSSMSELRGASQGSKWPSMSGTKKRPIELSSIVVPLELIVLLTSRKFRRLALASSDALPQKGFAWTMLTSPLFSSKPSLHWSVFSPVGIWLPDRAEN